MKSNFWLLVSKTWSLGQGYCGNKKTAGHNLPALKKERVKSFSAQHNSLISVEDQADGTVLPTVK